MRQREPALEVGERVVGVDGDRGIEVGQRQRVFSFFGVYAPTPDQGQAMLRTDPQALRQVGDGLFLIPEVAVQKPAFTERIR